MHAVVCVGDVNVSSIVPGVKGPTGLWWMFGNPAHHDNTILYSKPSLYSSVMAQDVL